MATTAASFWGLHPLFWVDVHLFACQLLSAPPVADDALLAAFVSGHPVRSVLLSGTVVSIKQREGRYHIALDDGTGVVDCVVFTHSMSGTPKADVPHMRLGSMLQVSGTVKHTPWHSQDPGRPLWEVAARTVRALASHAELLAAWATTMRLWVDEYSHSPAQLAPALPPDAVVADSSAGAAPPATAACLPRLPASPAADRRAQPHVPHQGASSSAGAPLVDSVSTHGTGGGEQGLDGGAQQPPDPSGTRSRYTLHELESMHLSQLASAVWLALRDAPPAPSTADSSASSAAQAGSAGGSPHPKRDRAGAAVDNSPTTDVVAPITAQSTLRLLLDPSHAAAGGDGAPAAVQAAEFAVMFRVLSVLHELAHTGELLLCTGATAAAAAAPSQFDHDDLGCSFLRVSLRGHVVPALLHAAVSIMWPAAAVHLQECARSGGVDAAAAAAAALADRAVDAPWGDTGIQCESSGADDIAAKAKALWSVTQHVSRPVLRAGLRVLEGEGWLIQLAPGEHGPADWGATLGALASLLPQAMAEAQAAGLA